MLRLAFIAALLAISTGCVHRKVIPVTVPVPCLHIDSGPCIDMRPRYLIVVPEDYTDSSVEQVEI